MVLIDIDSEREIDRIPGRREFDILRGRLSTAEFDAMVTRIDELIDEAGAEIATAGWLPGSDWRGTPFQPIYEKAAREDFGRSAMFFGQMVWYTVMNRPERWGSGKYQVDGRDIGSRTYFRLKASDSRVVAPIENRSARDVRLSKALGVALHGETRLGLGQFADNSALFGDWAWLYVEYEGAQHHPASNVLKYWPHLEQHRRERVFLLDVFALDARQRKGPRSDLTDWVAARMMRSFRGRFTYLRIEDRPAALRSAGTAVRDWSA